MAEVYTLNMFKAVKAGIETDNIVLLRNCISGLREEIGLGRQGVCSEH